MRSEQSPGDAAPSEYAKVAAAHGIPLQVARPPLGKYLADLWSARNFIWVLARTRAYARNENTYLGQLWAILNPLLYAGVYGLIFGVLLDTREGIENFVAFLVIGVFIFQFCSGSMSKGATSVIGNTSMIRSLRFPRAALPISVVITELLTVLPAVVVMFVIVSATREPVSWTWLLAVPVFGLISLFNIGVGMLLARLVTKSRDLRNLIPFVTQVLRYTSGVFFSIALVVPPGLVADLLHYQPYALALELMRGALLEQFTISGLELAVMTGWTVVALVGGLLFFWRGEGKYGIE